jgi:hypothetical protein
VNATDTRHRGGALDLFAFKALVIPLTVVVLDVLRDSPAEMAFTERNHAVETLMLDRAYEALRIGVRVRRLKRRPHHTDPGLAQPLANSCAPLGSFLSQ